VQRHVLCLGEINDSQRAAWQKSIEVFDEQQGQSRQCVLFKAVWLASDQLCSKLLKPVLPVWLEHHQRRFAPLPRAFKKKLLAVSPA